MVKNLEKELALLKQELAIHDSLVRGRAGAGLGHVIRETRGTPRGGQGCLAGRGSDGQGAEAGRRQEDEGLGPADRMVTVREGAGWGVEGGSTGQGCRACPGGARGPRGLEAEAPSPSHPSS